MKSIKAILALAIATGCGAPAEPDELGTNAQAIWVAEYAGWKAPNGLRCDPNVASTCFFARGNATGLPGSAAYNRFEYTGGQWPHIRTVLDTLGYSTDAMSNDASQYIIDNTGFGWAFGDLGSIGLYDLEWAFNESLFAGTPPTNQNLPITSVTAVSCVAQSAPLAESPGWPATFRYCDRVRVTLDLGAIAGWINGQSASQVDRNELLRSLFVNVKGAAMGLGRNNNTGSADIMWMQLGKGANTDPGYSDLDLCLANSIDLSANPDTISVVNDWCN